MRSSVSMCRGVPREVQFCGAVPEALLLLVAGQRAVLPVPLLSGRAFRGSRQPDVLAASQALEQWVVPANRLGSAEESSLFLGSDDHRGRPAC